MSELFFDASVVLDFLLKRDPFDRAALRRFQLSDQEQIRLYVSAVTFNNAYYIAARLQSKAKALQMMLDVSGLVVVTPVNERVIPQAFVGSFTDF